MAMEKLKKYCKIRIYVIFKICLDIIIFMHLELEKQSQPNKNYKDLEKLFTDWREFEKPPTLDAL